MYLQMLCFVLGFQLIYTHLCLLNPLQRGGVTDLNKKGSSACFLVKGPCGEKQDQAPDTFWTVGENVTVVFQKNLDHWTKANPGYFSISLMNATVIKELTRVPDMGEVSLTLYTPTIAVPQSLSTGAYTLQVMYVTNNPAAPEAFYQCTDVGIINS